MLITIKSSPVIFFSDGSFFLHALDQKSTDSFVLLAPKQDTHTSTAGCGSIWRMSNISLRISSGGDHEGGATGAHLHGGDAGQRRNENRAYQMQVACNFEALSCGQEHRM